ncbi:vanadium-dependent haloperoxidase [Bradyrhizobium sp. SSUT18]|uniref:vanadium-dependent haloperoxidase n=1 Tax=Bradyrhizobium sp. SSUT18 TaxID=3040602 RepID=UPI00244B937A|nr:vanadium-dependent haloperoxidase [Bradyrhizobium sp. SSUT18]MDH2406856.1 vanadium-dependent haloperoxidase [Bradyrhizobium sp. SSUT18]
MDHICSSPPRIECTGHTPRLHVAPSSFERDRQYCRRRLRMTATSKQLRYWVDMAIECVRRDHTQALSPGDQKGPFLTARALGMALAALNDAHAHASSRPRLLNVAAPPGLGSANAQVAAAAACAQVLLRRYPNQTRFLDPAWSTWLEYFGLGQAGSSAEHAGRAFGDAVHALGASDATNAAADQYTATGAPYTHIAPPNQPTQRYAGGKWGECTPLLATRIANFPAPPGRISPTQVEPTPHYQADFAKIVEKGGLQRTAGSRTLAEEVVGTAWGYDGPPELGTPPRLYLQVLLTALDAIEARTPGKLTLADELTIVGGAAVAMADAGIDAWHYKYADTHMMWRPVVGIQRAVTDNGKAVPNWLPLGRPDTNGSGIGLTPDFPAYPSGHATFGAAAFQLLRLFLVEKGVTSFNQHGVDKFAFDFVSDEYNGRNNDPRTMLPRDHLTLSHDSLWSVITDNSVSRVYLGVHWQFDGITKRNGANTADELGIPTPDHLGHTGGVWLGAQIANQIAPRLGISPATIAASKII